MRACGVYASGALYAAGFYLMLDTALWSAHKNPTDMHIGFVDWIPLVLVTLGMAIINLVERSRLTSGMAFGYEYGGHGTWQARVVLFVGTAFLSGGGAGSVLILLLRYIIPDRSRPEIFMGFFNILSSILIMNSSTCLWLAQNVKDDYSYSLQH